MDLDKSFEKFMGDVMPEVQPGSPEWWQAKKGFIGGVGTGITIPSAEYEGISQRLNLAYDDAIAGALVAQVPEQHRPVGPDGRMYFTEQGVIHLATLMEAERPEEAEKIRQVRYRIQAMAKQRREEGQP